MGASGTLTYIMFVLTVTVYTGKVAFGKNVKFY